MNLQALTPRALRSITGLNLPEFAALALAFDQAWHQAEQDRPLLRAQHPRIRRCGAGRNGSLPSIRAKLLFILLWFKVYPTFDGMGVLFGLHPSQACRWAHRLTPVLEAALKRKLCLPARRAANLEEIFASFTELRTFLIDGTDRPVRRPKNGRKRKARYSGRKKRYAVKNILAAAGRRVVLLGRTRPGCWHDKRCLDRERWRFPAGSTILGDRGFSGYAQTDATVLTPFRRPNGRDTPPRQRRLYR